MPDEEFIDLSKWLTLKEAAALLGYVNSQSASLLVRAGKLRAVNRSASKKADFRVDPASVQAFIRSRLVEPPPPAPRPPPWPNGLPPGVERFF